MHNFYRVDLVYMYSISKTKIQICIILRQCIVSVCIYGIAISSLYIECHHRIKNGTFACLYADGEFQDVFEWRNEKKNVEETDDENFCSNITFTSRTLAHQHQLRINWNIRRGENDTKSRRIPTAAMTSIAILK